MSAANVMEAYQAMVNDGRISAYEDQLTYAALGLCGEAGEAVEVIKKSCRTNDGHQHLDIDKLTLELGDVLWYLTRIAGLLDYTLEEIAALNIAKLHKRHPEQYPKLLMEVAT